MNRYDRLLKRSLMMILRQKLTLAFREHGLSITAVLTPESDHLNHCGYPKLSASAPPRIPNKFGEWMKSKLKAIAKLFGRLAGEATTTRPGIIGSIIVGARHIWLFWTEVCTKLKIRYIARTKITQHITSTR